MKTRSDPFGNTNGTNEEDEEGFDETRLLSVMNEEDEGGGGILIPSKVTLSEGNKEILIEARRSDLFLADRDKSAVIRS